jgi:hypothetical protein
MKKYEVLVYEPNKMYQARRFIANKIKIITSGIWTTGQWSGEGEECTFFFPHLIIKHVKVVNE